MSIHFSGTLDGVPFVYTPEFGLYPDNTPWAKGLPPKDMHVADIFIFQSSLADFVASMLYLESMLLYRDLNLPRLVIPFYPASRQDRSNIEGDLLQTKGYVSSLIDRISSNFSEVVTFDMHSNLRNPWGLVNVQPSEIIYGFTGRQGGSINPTPGYYDTVIAPDHGARYRAEAVAALYHTPVVVAEKVRDLSTGRITHYAIDNSVTEMAKVLVIDDICDGGATFEILADSLPYQTEKHLFVTHGLFSRGVGALASRYDHIITTNSIRQESHHGVQVIDLFPGVDLPC